MILVCACACACAFLTLFNGKQALYGFGMVEYDNQVVALRWPLEFSYVKRLGSWYNSGDVERLSNVPPPEFPAYRFMIGRYSFCINDPYLFIYSSRLSQCYVLRPAAVPNKCIPIFLLIKFRDQLPNIKSSLFRFHHDQINQTNVWFTLSCSLSSEVPR